MMPLILPRHITVLVDTREQKPLPLPKTIRWSQVGGDPRLIEVRSEPLALYAGDYILKEAPKLCIIERKGNINELHDNLQGRDQPRALRAFRKLVEATENPILALDFPLSQTLYNGDRDELFTRLAQLCARYRLQVICGGIGVKARHLLSDLIVRILLSHYLTGKETQCNSSQSQQPLLKFPIDH